MILYHYTSHLYLPIIQEERLSLGRVPISLSERQNAVWLTSDMIGRDHRLGPDPETCEQLSRQTGRVVCMANKLAVRIRVKIPPNDLRLVYWPKWAKKRLAPYFYDAVAQTGGNLDKTWWLYRGVIPPTWFIAIDILAPLTEYDLALQKALTEGTARCIDAVSFAGA